MTEIKGSSAQIHKTAQIKGSSAQIHKTAQNKLRWQIKVVGCKSASEVGLSVENVARYEKCKISISSCLRTLE